MGTFRKVAKTTDLEPGTATLVEIDGEKIALFNVAGEFYAIDNIPLPAPRTSAHM